MLLIVDESIVLYAIRFGTTTEDASLGQYIAQRLIETVPRLDKKHCLWFIQELEDQLDDDDILRLSNRQWMYFRDALFDRLKAFK